MQSSTWMGVRLILRKEFVTGFRFRTAWVSLFMFALTTLSAVSIAMQGGVLEARLQAALYWVILFFSAMTGIDRLFAEEESMGTLLALRLYGGSQAVILGKMLYLFCVLVILAVLVTPLFLVFLSAPVAAILPFIGTVILGCWGIAAAGTLISSLTVGSRLRNGLSSVLLFPVILPVFLPAISLTAGSFGYGGVELSYLGGILLYDLVLTVGASVLFDFLWYED